MALDRSDLWARLLGFLFFLPILIPVLVGYPYILIGTGFAAIWVVYEACKLLGRGVCCPPLSGDVSYDGGIFTAHPV